MVHNRRADSIVSSAKWIDSRFRLLENFSNSIIKYGSTLIVEINKENYDFPNFHTSNNLLKDRLLLHKRIHIALIML